MLRNLQTYPVYPQPTTDEPTMEDLKFMIFDSTVEATDGCIVEPDGVCPHGYPSWLVHLGYV